MSRQSWIGYYIGKEFPEYYGTEIEIQEGDDVQKALQKAREFVE